MQTYKLLCKKRDLAVKAKKLKKSGYIPATVYGHSMEPISIQIDQINVLKYMKEQSIGSKVLLDIEGEEQLAIFKDSQRDTLTYKTIHLDFQALKKGEKIKVAVPVVFLNRDSVNKDEILQEQLSEIEISALPKDLIDHVDVDVAKYKLGDAVTVADLDVMKNKNVEVLTAEDAQVCVITHAAKFTEETVDEEPAAEAAEEVAAE